MTLYSQPTPSLRGVYDEAIQSVWIAAPLSRLRQGFGGQAAARNDV